jgi:methyl acetate hydrolase
VSFGAFEAALAKAVEEGKIAGAVALVTDRDGVTYEHAAGVRAVGQPAAMDGATVFWIASMTKAVVSVAALQLVERGKLTLDGDLGELCPDLKDLQVLEGVAEGKPKLRPAKGFVTLRQLLSHTSGFAYTFTHPEFLAYSQTEGALDPNSGSRAAHRQPLMFDPGQGWIYGIGIDWAGIVIEAASGQRLDAYLAENIFGPLAMFDTGFACPRARRRARPACMCADPTAR